MPGLKIEAIIFDADGVIFDSEKLWDIGDGQFMAKRGVPKIKKEIKVKLAGTSLMDGTALLLSSHGILEDVHQAALERIKIMDSLYSRDIEFMKGFTDFFGLVKTIGYRTAVATSMSKNLFPSIDQKLGFLSMFENHVYSVSEVNHAKPAPDIYLHASSQINIKPENCLVIEDAPNGIKAAKSAGMFCIGLATTFKPKYLIEADIVFNSFVEISEYINKYEMK